MLHNCKDTVAWDLEDQCRADTLRSIFHCFVLTMGFFSKSTQRQSMDQSVDCLHVVSTEIAGQKFLTSTICNWGLFNRSLMHLDSRVKISIRKLLVKLNEELNGGHCIWNKIKRKYLFFKILSPGHSGRCRENGSFYITYLFHCSTHKCCKAILVPTDRLVLVLQATIFRSSQASAFDWIDLKWENIAGTKN